ncbi:hypothetical protein QE430_002119 [Microbacterium testaceum]|nr:hypothetical protein [Microbacterium testaceum]
MSGVRNSVTSPSEPPDRPQINEVAREQPSRRFFLATASLATLAGIAGASFVPSGEAIAWGGYGNGRIPLSALTEVTAGQWFQPDAAQKLTQLRSAFQSALNVPLVVNSGYRSYADQVTAYQNWKNGTGNYAADPGTSNHGWGLAADFGGAVYSGPNTTAHSWLRSNAGNYGWWWAGATFRIVEPWHWEFNGNINTPTPVTPTDGEIEDMQTVVAAPNGTVVHISPAGKVNFGSAQQYNIFRAQISTLRNAGATTMMAMPPLEQVVNVNWETFNFLCQINGVATA